MKYKGTLIVVKDIKKSLEYYRNLFNLELIKDNDGNMELTNGIFLQEEKYWKKFLMNDITSKSNRSEIYFEEDDIEGFIKKLNSLYPKTEYVNKLTTYSWGQKVVRFYDLDGNLIEVGTPI